MKVTQLHWALYGLVLAIAVAIGIIVAEKVIIKAEQVGAEITA